MTLIEQALDLVQKAIIEIDAKQWKEIKELNDAPQIVAKAMESQALQRISLEIRKQIEGMNK